MTILDINHTDDSTEACAAFRERSNHRRHIDIPKMTGQYRFEATVHLFTNRTSTNERCPK